MRSQGALTTGRLADYGGPLFGSIYGWRSERGRKKAQSAARIPIGALSHVRCELSR
jgi:hypothetical protein